MGFFVFDLIEDTVNGFINLVDGAISSVFDIGEKVLEEGFDAIGIEGETVYFTAVETQRLIPDEPVNSIQGIILDHALSNAPIAHALHMRNMTGSVINIQKYYAQGDLHYYYGTPTVGIYTVDNVNSKIKSAVDVYSGEPSKVTSVDYTLLNVNDWIRWYLQQNLAGFIYDTDSKTVSGTPYYYDGYTENGNGDYVIVLRNPSVFRYETFKETTIETNQTTLVVYATTIKEHTVTYLNGIEISDVYAAGEIVTGTPTGVGIFQSVTQDLLANIIEEKSLYFATGVVVPKVDSTNYNYITFVYTKNSAPSVEYIWIYDRTTGVYPDLNLRTFAPKETESSFIPIVPIRQDFISITEDLSGIKTKTTRALLNTIGLNLTTLVKGLEESPDTDKIREAAVVFGINVYTESAEGIAVLYKWATQLHYVQLNNADDFDNLPEGVDNTINYITIGEQSYKVLLQYNYVRESVVAGTILTGEVGTVEREIIIKPNSDETVDEETSSNTGGGVPMSELILRKQITPTTYKQYIISGIVQTTYVKALDNTYHANLIKLEVAGDEDTQRNFILPLDLSMVIDEDSTYEQQEIVLYESLHLVIFAAGSAYLKWYQTASFAQIVKIVMLVITIVFTFFGGPPGQTAAQALWLIAKKMLYQYALTVVLTKVLEQGWGGNFGRAVAIAAYVYASYEIWSGDAIAAGEKLSTADKFLFNTSAVFDATGIDQKVQFDALQDEIDSFTNLEDARLEELQALMDSLDPDHDIDVFELKEMLSKGFYEDADSFYERTIHTGNPGVLALDEVTTYVDRKLQLPELG